MQLTVTFNITKTNRSMIFEQLNAIAEFICAGDEVQSSTPEKTEIKGAKVAIGAEQQLSKKAQVEIGSEVIAEREEKETKPAKKKAKATKKKARSSKKAHKDKSLDDISNELVSEENFNEIVNSFDDDLEDTNDIDDTPIEATQEHNYELVEIRDLARAYVKQNSRGKEDVKKLLTEHGADSLNTLKQSKYNTFYKELSHIADDSLGI